MLTKDNIREIVFNNYSVLLNYAVNKFTYLASRGLPAEELVNQAVVNIFDVTMPFLTEESLLSFIYSNLSGTAKIESDSIKDNNYFLKTNEKGYLVDRTDTIMRFKAIGPSSQFIEMYNLFEDCKYGIEHIKKCRFCGCTSFYSLKDGRYKCKACLKKMSILSGTSITNMNISYAKFYQLVGAICREPELSSVTLAKDLGLSQKTAYYRKRLIISTMNTINSTDPIAILEKLLKFPELDAIKIKDVGTNNDKFNKDTILTMKRLYRDGIHNISELSSIYSLDASSMSKIINNKLYKKYQLI